MLRLAVLQPFVFATPPIAIVPDFPHEAGRLLVNAFVLVPLHQLEGKADAAPVAQVFARKLKLSRKSLKRLRANVAQFAVADRADFTSDATQFADRVAAHAQVDWSLQQPVASRTSKVAQQLKGNRHERIGLKDKLT